MAIKNMGGQLMKRPMEVESRLKELLEVAKFSSPFHEVNGDIFCIAVTLNLAVNVRDNESEHTKDDQFLIAVMKTCALALNNIGWRKMGPLSDSLRNLVDYLEERGK